MKYRYSNLAGATVILLIPAILPAADAPAIRELREQLESDDDLRAAHGALVVNLDNVLEAMDAVADAQPVRERTPAQVR